MGSKGEHDQPCCARGRGETRGISFIHASARPAPPFVHPSNHPSIPLYIKYSHERKCLTSLSLPSFSCHKPFAEKRSLVRQSKDIKFVSAQKCIKGLLRKLVGVRKRSADLAC